MYRRLFSIRILVSVALAFAVAVPIESTKADAGDSISGVVFFDTDMDGVRDANEAPAPGMTVEYLGNGTIATTDSEGRYSFTGLQPYSGIDYTIRLRLTTDIPCATTTTFAQNVPAGVESSNVDFGVFASGDKQVAGVLVNDLNENGVADPGEPGLDGWQLRIYGQGGFDGDWWDLYCAIGSTSDATGQFTFARLVPGYFFLEVMPPSFPEHSENGHSQSHSPPAIRVI